MMKARNQADNYTRAVAKEDGWPPFLMIVDMVLQRMAHAGLAPVLDAHA